MWIYICKKTFIFVYVFYSLFMRTSPNNKMVFVSFDMFIGLKNNYNYNSLDWSSPNTKKFTRSVDLAVFELQNYFRISVKIKLIALFLFGRYYYKFLETQFLTYFFSVKFLNNILLFSGDWSQVWGRIDQFWSRINQFWGRIDRYWGHIDQPEIYWGRIDHFLGRTDRF